MPDPFDETETAYTATAGTLGNVSAGVDQVDFSRWGNPERQKINDSIPAVNLYNSRRFEIW